MKIIKYKNCTKSHKQKTYININFIYIYIYQLDFIKINIYLTTFIITCMQCLFQKKRTVQKEGGGHEGEEKGYG